MLFPLFFSHSGEKSAWVATTDMCRHSPREQLDVPVCRRKQLLHVAGQGSIHYQEIGKFPWTFQTKTMAMIKQLTYLFAVSPVLSREGSGRCHCFSRPLPLLAAAAANIVPVRCQRKRRGLFPSPVCPGPNLSPPFSSHPCCCGKARGLSSFIGRYDHA